MTQPDLFSSLQSHNQRVVNSYHQTTSLTASQKSEFEEKAKGQEEKILEWFRSNPEAKRSPRQILKEVFHNTAEITSIRRAMTNMTLGKKGRIKWLVMLDEQIISDEGKGHPEHLWRLNK